MNRAPKANPPAADQAGDSLEDMVYRCTLAEGNRAVRGTSAWLTVPVTLAVCGAMGGEAIYAALLLGLGVRRLSMPPHQLPEIKRVIRAIRHDQARILAAEILGLSRVTLRARLRAMKGFVE